MDRQYLELLGEGLAWWSSEAFSKGMVERGTATAKRGNPGRRQCIVGRWLSKVLQRHGGERLSRVGRWQRHC